MSILFDALNKAARDYRSHKAPVIVPLLSTRSVPFFKRRIRIACALVFALVAGIGIGVWGTGPKQSNGPVVSESVQSQTPAALTEAASSRKVRKAEEGEELGIELPEAAFMAEEKVKGMARHVADKIKDAPAVTNSPSHGVIENASGAENAIVIMEESSSGFAKKALFSQATAAIAAKDLDKALKVYMRILAFDKNDQDAFYGVIFIHEQKGGARGLAALDSMLVTKPDCAALHAGRARILARQKKLEPALEAWQRAVYFEPSNNAYKLGMAILYDQLGKVDEAMRAYRDVSAPLPPQAQKRLDYLAEQKQDANGTLSVTQLDEEE